MPASVDYWRVLRANGSLLLCLFISGYQGDHRARVEARLLRDGLPLDVPLALQSNLAGAPASVEVEIDASALTAGRYEVEVTLAGAPLGTFPCEVALAAGCR